MYEQWKIVRKWVRAFKCVERCFGAYLQVITLKICGAAKKLTNKMKGKTDAYITSLSNVLYEILTGRLNYQKVVFMLSIEMGVIDYKTIDYKQSI